MTDNYDNGNLKIRRILAPHPWPFLPSDLSMEGEGPFFYLSWPGWELYLRRRLNLNFEDGSAKSLLLPDVADPERDFLYLDQLAQRSAQLGAGAVDLNFTQAEGLSSLLSDIRSYTSPQEQPAGQPLLDDRSYLALWAVSEFRALESDLALAQAQARQSDLLASIQGENLGEYDELAENRQPEQSVSGSILNDRLTIFPLREADSRAVYAWKCWRRLTWGLISDSDQIIPTLIFPSEN